MNEVQQDDPSAGTNSSLAFVKNILASAGGLLALLYAAGFVVVGTNLLHHGLVDPGLADARYVSVGACFMILLCSTVAPVACFCFAAIRGGLSLLDRRLSWERIAHRVDWPIVIQGGFLLPLLLFVLAVGLPIRVILLVAHTGTGAEALRYGENVPLYWSTLWHLLPDWFLPVSACGMFVGEMLALGDVLRDAARRIAKSNTEKHIVLASNQLETQRSDVKWVPNANISLFFNIILLPVILFLLLIAVHTYATEIYPLIKSSFGGGDFGYVRFVFEKGKVPQIPGLVPVYQEDMSRSVRLLSDAGSGYAFLGRDERREYAGIVDKSLVRGLLAAEKEQKPDGLPGAVAHDK